MISYETLLNEVSECDIDICETSFKGGSHGFYLENTIFIDKKISSSAEKKCVLAEELGHHHTTYGNILDTDCINNIKQEKLARNWGYERLVGIIDLINAYNHGIVGKHNLAEYLNVTEAFLEEAINHYREKYGTHYQIDNYVIFFQPHFGILKNF